jgi:hypothetical protein
MKLMMMIAVLGVSLLSACGSTVRAVTHVSTWATPKGDYLYVAYAENSDVSKIRKCNVNADNTITCTEQEDANKLLNAED